MTEPSETPEFQYFVLHVNHDKVKDADGYGPYASREEAEAYAATLDDAHALWLYPPK